MRFFIAGLLFISLKFTGDWKTTIVEMVQVRWLLFVLHSVSSDRCSNFWRKTYGLMLPLWILHFRKRTSIQGRKKCCCMFVEQHYSIADRKKKSWSIQTPKTFCASIQARHEKLRCCSSIFVLHQSYIKNMRGSFWNIGFMPVIQTTTNTLHCFFPENQYFSVLHQCLHQFSEAHVSSLILNMNPAALLQISRSSSSWEPQYKSRSEVVASRHVSSHHW